MDTNQDPSRDKIHQENTRGSVSGSPSQILGIPRKRHFFLQGFVKPSTPEGTLHSLIYHVKGTRPQLLPSAPAIAALTDLFSALLSPIYLEDK